MLLYTASQYMLDTWSCTTSIHSIEETVCVQVEGLKQTGETDCSDSLDGQMINSCVKKA